MTSTTKSIGTAIVFSMILVAALFSSAPAEADALSTSSSSKVVLESTS